MQEFVIQAFLLPIKMLLSTALSRLIMIVDDVMLGKIHVSY